MWHRASLTALLFASLLIAAPACDGPPEHDPAPPLPAVQAPNQLRILNGRLRAVPPGVRISAAYLEIVHVRDEAENEAEGPADRLLSARMLGAYASARVEIHRTIVDDAGVMRMRPIPTNEGLPVVRGASTRLEPGGLHLMIFELPAEPRPGEVAHIELQLERAGQVRVPLRVFDGDAQSAHSH